MPSWIFQLGSSTAKAFVLNLQLTLHHAQIMRTPDPRVSAPPLQPSASRPDSWPPPLRWELSVVSDTQSGSFRVPSCLRNACLDWAQHVCVSHTHTHTRARSSLWLHTQGRTRCSCPWTLSSSFLSHDVMLHLTGMISWPCHWWHINIYAPTCSTRMWWREEEFVPEA